MSSAPIKHVPIIDPGWPETFRDPAFWDRREPRQADRYAANCDWTAEQIWSTAALLSKGYSHKEIATAIGRKTRGVEKKIHWAGGEEAFIAKFARVEGREP